MENIHIKTAEGTETLTIMQGKALTPREPVKVVINGSISSPRIYIETRKADKTKDHLIFSRSKMFIKYFKDELDSLGAEVSGTLSLNPELEEFGINTGKKRAPKELASFLKLKRTFFLDKEKNALIISALNNFQATITTELEKAQDTRGNSKQLVEKKVISNTPTEFVLQMPIFVGQETKKFSVEICIDTTDSGVSCWLESAELNDLIILNRDQIIDSEIAAIQKVEALAVIEQL